MISESFVYTWINVTNGRMYIGYHKGNPDDGYISSSKNEDFWNDLDSGNLKRQIIAQGTKEDCYSLETKLIQTIGLKNLYNQCIYPVFNDTPEIRKKISDTLKRKGNSPYSEKTHAPETIRLREQNKKDANLRWYHNPVDLEYKMFRTTYEKVPDGWVPGRKPKKEKISHVINHVRNVKTWRLYIDGNLLFFGQNLKKYLAENGYSTLYPNLTKTAKTKDCYYSRKYEKTFQLELK